MSWFLRKKIVEHDVSYYKTKNKHNDINKLKISLETDTRTKFALVNFCHVFEFVIKF